MKLRRWAVPGILVLCLAATGAYGECTLRDRQALYDAGMSLYEIDRVCGETRYTDPDRHTDIPEPESIRPRRPDTHGRLQEHSDICQTDGLWCRLPQAGPPGTPCQCTTRYGPAYGTIVRK